MEEVRDEVLVLLLWRWSVVCGGVGVNVSWRLSCVRV